jgi:hypothetical protein
VPTSLVCLYQRGLVGGGLAQAHYANLAPIFTLKFLVNSFLTYRNKWHSKWLKMLLAVCAAHGLEHVLLPLADE